MVILLAATVLAIYKPWGRIGRIDPRRLARGGFRH